MPVIYESICKGILQSNHLSLFWGKGIGVRAFYNISIISWLSVLLMGETGVHGENHRPVASHWCDLWKYMSWSWSYGSCVFNYLCNQCLSPQTLWVWIPLIRGVLDTTLYVITFINDLRQVDGFLRVQRHKDVCRINNTHTIRTIYNTYNTQTYDWKRTQDIIHVVALIMLTDIRTFNRSNNIYRRSYGLKKVSNRKQFSSSSKKSKCQIKYILFYR
jgi:hypothetical protein